LTEALRRHIGVKGSLFVVPAEISNREMSKTAFLRMWNIVTGKKHIFTKRDNEGKIMRDSHGKVIKEEGYKPGLIDFHVTPHLLRHTFITELCASGLDIKKIQYLAGHASVAMTLDVYTQVTQNRPEQLIEGVNKAFSRLPTGLPDKAVS
jgi:site-specific recombinase XerD